jgi:hypothetical protein
MKKIYIFAIYKRLADSMWRMVVSDTCYSEQSEMAFRKRHAYAERILIIPARPSPQESCG